MINGGFIEDASLCLSGGIYTTYWLELIMHFSRNTPITSIYSKSKLNSLTALFKNPRMVIPTPDEFYEILRYAVRVKNLLGCSSNNATATDRYGVYKDHQYVVTDAFILNKVRYVRVHNPHNQPDKLKK